MNFEKDYNFAMAKKCESFERCAKEADLKTFWRNAKIGFIRRWANSIRQGVTA